MDTRDEIEGAIVREPYAASSRLLYADWLASNGHLGAATYVRSRLEIERLLAVGAAEEDLDRLAWELTDLAPTVDPTVLGIAAIGAERWPGTLGFAPSRWSNVLPEVTGRRGSDTFRELRPRILVLADFHGEPDGRPVEDRHRAVLVTRGNLDQVIARMTAEAGDEGRARSDASFQGLRFILEQTSGEADVHILNLSKRDLIDDFDDAPTVRRSGLSIIANCMNHHGMRPFSAFVLGFDVDPRERGDGDLLRRLGEVGVLGVVPIVVGLAADAAGEDVEPAGLQAWRSTPGAGYVALATPSFEVTDGRGPISASFLAGALIARRASRLRVGAPLQGSLPRARLVGTVDADLARRRGWLAFGASDHGAHLVVDTTQRTGPVVRCSLSARLLLTRACHELLHVDLHGELSNKQPETEALLAAYDVAMAARFAADRGVRVTVRDLEWKGDHDGEAELSLTVPSPSRAHGITLRERMRLRVTL